MKLFLTSLVAVIAVAAQCFAAQPQLHTMQATMDPYPLANYPTGSNAVITIYKSTSLGTTWTPFKPTAVFPATRTNTFFQVVAPNTFQFYATVTIQPFGESDPSNTVTNVVTTSLSSQRLTLSRQLNAKPTNQAKTAKAHEKIKRPRGDALGTHRTPN